MAGEQEAKQLDSVTDVVKEAELDASKVEEAMSALNKQEEDEGAAALAAVEVSKEDVTLIVNELEVTEDVAEMALRQVAADGTDGSVLEAALRKLVTSGY